MNWALLRVIKFIFRSFKTWLAGDEQLAEIMNKVMKPNPTY